jgi:hypothetical protein
MKRLEFKEILDFLKSGYEENSISGYGQNLYFLEEELFTYNGKFLLSKKIKTNIANIAVNFGKLYTFINKSKSKDIEFLLNDTTLQVKANKSILEISINLLKDQFPSVINSNLDKANIILNPEEFRKGISLCKYSLGSNSISIFGNILVDNKKIVATNGKKLSTYDLNFSMGNFYIPADIVPILEKSNFKRYKVTDDFIYFLDNNSYVAYNKVDSNYPDYQKLLNNADNGEDIVFPSDIDDYIDLSTIFEDGRSEAYYVYLEIKDNKCSISSIGNAGKIITELDIESKKDFGFYINPNQLLSILKLTNTMELSSNKAIFKKDKYTYMFMVKMED